MMESAPPGGVLPTGKRGLLISHLVLQGVVREQTSNKMIAVVTNETKVARFLYENDSLYNGVVSKITPDAVYFKENVLDSNGRVTTHEVVKRLGSAPGEGR
jgi:type II secretory pathway component PulC